MYAIWTFLFFRALVASPRFSLKRTFWITIVGGTLIGIILEYGQLFLAQGRSFEAADMLANTFGAIIGSEVGYFYFLRKRK